MRVLSILLICCYFFFSCQENARATDSINEKELASILLGKYDNLHQVSQEEDSLVEPYKHIHTKFESITFDTTDKDNLYLIATHTNGKDSLIVLGKEIFEFWWNGEDSGSAGAKSWSTFSTIYQIPENQSITSDFKKIEIDPEILNWKKEGDNFTATNRKGQLIISLKNDTLNYSHFGKVLKNTSSGRYQMVKYK